MRLCLHLPPASARYWLKALVDRLVRDHGAEISLSWGGGEALPAHVEQLLAFERRHYHKGDHIPAMPLDRADLEPLVTAPTSNEAYDLVLDLSADGSAPTGKTVLTPLFNGHPGETALVSSIMTDGLPQIALRDEQGSIVATAQPSAELAVGVSGSMEQVYARLATLLSAWIAHPDRWTQALISRKADFPSAKSLRLRTLKALLRDGVKQLYYRFFRAAHWRTGWRFVEGEDAISLQSLAGETWQVLEDEETRFYADPVPWQQDGKSYIFIEDLDQDIQKGIISVVSFDDEGRPGPAEPCLEEPFHLSYPFLISHAGETYMIPETRANRAVTLYKARAFPFGWEPHKVILEDIDAADVTITRHGDKWWLFCVTMDGAGGYSDCLSLFHADDLFGPWQPHAQNPVLIDVANARPAGNMVHQDGKLIRPVQDCSQHYGAALNLVEVTHLTPDHYQQQTRAHLAPNKHWPGRKVHTLSRAGCLEVIDGAILRPRNRQLRRLAEHFHRPVGSQ